MDTEQTPVSPQSSAPPKKDPFSMFGKIAAVLIIAALLIGGGVYLGTNLNKSSTQPSPTPGTSQTSTDISPAAEKESPTAGASATPAVSGKTVAGGLTNGSTSFVPYSVKIPSGWTDNRETNDLTDKLTITKDSYSLTIYQAPIGGEGCLYKNDPPQDMAQSFSNYTDISSGQYRRSWNTTSNQPGTIGYTVCQKNTGGSYSATTIFGAISAKSPDPIDVKVMAEIDSIVSSLTKK